MHNSNIDEYIELELAEGATQGPFDPDTHHLHCQVTP